MKTCEAVASSRLFAFDFIYLYDMQFLLQRRRNVKNWSKRDVYRLMLKEFPDVMTAQQMCQALGVGQKTGYRLLKRQEIVSVKVGREYRIPKICLMDYLRMNPGEGK